MSRAPVPVLGGGKYIHGIGKLSKRHGASLAVGQSLGFHQDALSALIAVSFLWMHLMENLVFYIKILSAEERKCRNQLFCFKFNDKPFCNFFSRIISSLWLTQYL